MRVPLGWLRDFIAELPRVDELAERLTMAGLEVEEIHVPEQRFIDRLVVARVIAVEPHPNADRLSLCTIDDGTAERPIVCGAPNVVAGDAVVLASPGAVLPRGTKIKKAKIRGVESQGMLCSAAELDLYDDRDSILILHDPPVPGTPAAPLLGLSEPVLEVGITPNRGDCLSMRGIAREIAAVFDLEIGDALGHSIPVSPGEGSIPVRIDCGEDCLMYRGVEIRGVAVRCSPTWIVGRLASAGLRPINNVVDVTNYVLLEYGQPLHAFDADRLAGPAISVRHADRTGEIETLDGQRRLLAAEDLLIWDEFGPVAIAGVMGGARTAVDDATTNIFLESALFAPTAVRRTSRRLGLVSESSYRFERGVDPDGVEQALLRAGRLLAETAGGTMGLPVGAGAKPERPGPISLRPQRVAKVLGTTVGSTECEEVLERLGAEVARVEGRLEVRVPGARHDLVREIDLIEEIARIRGYDGIAAEVPVLPMHEATVPREVACRSLIRSNLTARGLNETVTLAFVAAKSNRVFPGLHVPRAAAVGVANPLRADASEMRMSLLPGLIEAAASNWRNGARVVDLFTVGRIFSTTGELDSVAGVLSGPRRARGPGDDGPAEFFDGKGAVEAIAAVLGCRNELLWRPCQRIAGYHPSASAEVFRGDMMVGRVGTVHPDVAEQLDVPMGLSLFEVALPGFLSPHPTVVTVDRVSRHPAASRDVSLIVPRGILAGDVIATVESLAEARIEEIRVFDEYRGPGIPEGSRALSFSIVYRALDRTLTDDEIHDLHEEVVERLTERLGVQRRG